MEILPKKVKELQLSTEMFDAAQTAAYVDSRLDNVVLMPDYTAFEVFPTLNNIPAGTESDIVIDYPEYYVNEWGQWQVGDICRIDAEKKHYTCIRAFDKKHDKTPGKAADWQTYWAEGNDHIKKYHYVYTVDVPAKASCKIQFYTWSQLQKDCNVEIVWGDGSKTIVKNDNNAEWSRLTGGGSVFYASHTYEDHAKFTVKVLGNDYYMLRCMDENSIISRVFDADLPVASCLKNVSSLCNGSLRLLNVNIPYEYQFKNITNFSNMFANCTNLRDAHVGEGAFTTRAQALNGIFQQCANLECNINQLNAMFAIWPIDGNLNSEFANCSKIYGTVNPYIYWKSIYAQGYVLSRNTFRSVFGTCSDEIRRQVPEFWGGFQPNLVPFDVLNGKAYDKQAQLSAMLADTATALGANVNFN